MGEEFDILQHPDTLKNVCSSAIVSGFGAAVAFGAFSMTRPWTNRVRRIGCGSVLWIVGCSVFSFSAMQARRRYDDYERLRSQDIEGMHFMKFESLAPPLSDDQVLDVDPNQINTLMKAANKIDSVMLNSSYTVTKSKIEKERKKQELSQATMP